MRRGTHSSTWRGRFATRSPSAGDDRCWTTSGISASNAVYTDYVLLSIGPDKLDVEQIAAELGDRVDSGADGAVVTFVGLVRNHNAGRRVLYLEYEAYEPLALKSFERIAEEVRGHWPSAHLALRHRVGRLDVGEAS